jgi:hypothetical protein
MLSSCHLSPQGRSHVARWSSIAPTNRQESVYKKLAKMYNNFLTLLEFDQILNCNHMIYTKPPIVNSSLDFMSDFQNLVIHAFSYIMKVYSFSFPFSAYFSYVDELFGGLVLSCDFVKNIQFQSFLKSFCLFLLYHILTYPALEFVQKQLNERCSRC